LKGGFLPQWDAEILARRSRNQIHKEFDPQMTQMAQMKNLGNRQERKDHKEQADAGTTFANARNTRIERRFFCRNGTQRSKGLNRIFALFAFFCGKRS
jgi:hypothetical protein